VQFKRIIFELKQIKRSNAYTIMNWNW